MIRTQLRQTFPLQTLSTSTYRWIQRGDWGSEHHSDAFVSQPSNYNGLFSDFWTIKNPKNKSQPPQICGIWLLQSAAYAADDAEPIEPLMAQLWTSKRPTAPYFLRLSCGGKANEKHREAINFLVAALLAGADIDNLLIFSGSKALELAEMINKPYESHQSLTFINSTFWHTVEDDEISQYYQSISVTPLDWWENPDNQKLKTNLKYLEIRKEQALKKSPSQRRRGIGRVFELLLTKRKKKK
jgi:hypothetical protein